MKRVIRYVKRITIPVTRACINDCIYCGFRRQDASLITLSQVRAIFDLARKQGCSEIRLMAGTNPAHYPSINQELDKLSLNSLAQYAYIIANMVLNYGFLPSIEIGLLHPEELSIVSKVAANISLLLECKKDAVFKTYRSKHAYLEMIEIAGQLKIPFTTGIVVGLGETQQERFEVISQLAKLSNQYKHIQEFVIQGYILNERTRLPVQNFLTLKELVDLFTYIERSMPGLMIQVQPNTLDFWLDLIKIGVQSIGGISEEIDYVVPRYHEEDIKDVTMKLKKIKCILQKQLPLTVGAYKAGLYPAGIKNVLQDLVESKEYRYYKK